MMRHDSCPPRRRRPTGAALAGIVLALGWTACGKDVRRPLGAGDHGGRIAPADLRCEYRSDPLGIDAPRPRLSWALAALDPALFVTPPPGLEVGYVPIVTRQEAAGGAAW
jgi:hypothetical protein